MKTRNKIKNSFSNFGKVPQFHGKWPFLAIPLPFGFIIQEPASVIFSLLNLFTVYKMLQRFKRMKDLPNRTMWLIYAHVGMFTWISSTLFHMFDCDITEKMDYFGAYTFVLSAFYVSLVFTSPQLQYSLIGRRLIKLMQLLFIGVFLKHFQDMAVSFSFKSSKFKISIVTDPLRLWLQHVLLHNILSLRHCPLRPSSL